jgi:hypothetical protein
MVVALLIAALVGVGWYYGLSAMAPLPEHHQARHQFEER